MLITHLICRSPEQTTHFEVKHQNGSHGITSLEIKTSLHDLSLPWLQTDLPAHHHTSQCTLWSQQPPGEYLFSPRTTKQFMSQGESIAVWFFLECWLSDEAVFPFMQQRSIAQPYTDSTGGAKCVLLHIFCTAKSTENHSSRMSVQAGPVFGVYEILIQNVSPTVCTLEKSNQRKRKHSLL